jgi:uncharacterized protein DUF2180
MKCYICSKQPGVDGTHFHIREAVGICHNCGVAVCETHSVKGEELGSPLLCPNCAQLQQKTKDIQVDPVAEPA